MWIPNLITPGDLMLAELRGGAVRAVVDAATALFLGDALDRATKSALLHRWESTGS